MPELPNIPLHYKEGVYGASELAQIADADDDNAISLDYDTQYQILDYVIPAGEDGRAMTLYSVPEDDLYQTARRL